MKLSLSSGPKFLFLAGGVVFTIFLLRILFFPFKNSIQSDSVDPFKVNTKISFNDSMLIYRDIIKSFDPRAVANILRNHQDYHSKAPFPHTFIDDLFPMQIVKSVSQEIPDNPLSSKDGCVLGSDACFKHEKTQHAKNAYTDEIHFGPATFALFAFMKSSTFVSFLEKLTGIPDLIADPHYRGSGVHQTLSGGNLNVHADFNKYERYQLHRRVNAFVYLNEDWDDSYGGHLELWPKNMSACTAKIRPSLGRFVVFSSTDFSYHGHPDPLECPKNRSRRSIALYYYTRDRPTSECLQNDCNLAHTTLFQTPKSKCNIAAV